MPLADHSPDEVRIFGEGYEHLLILLIIEATRTFITICLLRKMQDDKQRARGSMERQQPSCLPPPRQYCATYADEFTNFGKLPLELREMVWEYYLVGRKRRCIILIHDGPREYWGGRVVEGMRPDPTLVRVRVCEAGSNKPYYRPTWGISREVYATAKRLKWKPFPQFDIIRDMACSNLPNPYFELRESTPIDLNHDVLYIATTSLLPLRALMGVPWASQIQHLAVRFPVTRASCNRVVDSFSDVLPRLTKLRRLLFVTPIKECPYFGPRDADGFMYDKGMFYYIPSVKPKLLLDRRLQNVYLRTVLDTIYSPFFINISPKSSAHLFTYSSRHGT